MMQEYCNPRLIKAFKTFGAVITKNVDRYEVTVSKITLDIFNFLNFNNTADGCS